MDHPKKLTLKEKAINGFGWLVTDVKEKALKGFGWFVAAVFAVGLIPGGGHQRDTAAPDANSNFFSLNKLGQLYAKYNPLITSLDSKATLPAGLHYASPEEQKVVSDALNRVHNDALSVPRHLYAFAPKLVDDKKASQNFSQLVFITPPTSAWQMRSAAGFGCLENEAARTVQTFTVDFARSAQGTASDLKTEQAATSCTEALATLSQKAWGQTARNPIRMRATPN